MSHSIRFIPKSILNSLVVISLLVWGLVAAGCDSGPNGPDFASSGDDAGTTLTKSPNDGMVTVPFRAEFFTLGEIGADAPNVDCGADLVEDVHQGRGEATHLGRFSIYGAHCLELTIPPEPLPYSSGFFTLTAANGDELWIETSGVVVPSDDSNYAFEFSDPCEFVGGTGRFEGTRGTGTCSGKVGAGRVDHVWSGELTVPRGK